MELKTQKSKPSPQVLIIGAGIVGCSIAYHLTLRGLRDVLVVEQNTIASGASCRAAGGIRQQFSNPTNIRMAQYSLDFFENFKARLGLDENDGDLDFQQVGYLFLLTKERDWQAFQEHTALQRRLGVEVRVLTAPEAAELSPGLNQTGILGATFTPRDGHGSQHEVIQGFARQARQQGARFWENCAVTALKRHNRRIIEVQTTNGPVRPDLIIGCAGAWSGRLGQMTGVDIPVRPLRRNLYYAEATAPLPPHIPVTVDVETGFYFRREGAGYLFGEIRPRQPVGFDTSPDWDWLSTVVEHAIERVPAFENLQIRNAWAGLYDSSPDNNALIGAVPELDNFYVATGFSDHGLLQSPATGLLMSEIILDGAAHTIDISEFSPARFQQGDDLMPERVII